MVLRSEFAPAPVATKPFYEIILDAVWKHAANNPNKPAVIDAEDHSRFITFRELYLQSMSVHAFMLQRNFGRGQVAAIVLPACWEYSVFFLGASACGGAVSGASPMFTDYELGRQFEDSQCTAVFTNDEALSKVRHAAQSCPRIETIVVLRSDARRQLPLGLFAWEDVIATQPCTNAPTISHNVDTDLQMLPYSSGTTGPPKGVMLSHKNMGTILNIFSSHFDNAIMPRLDPHWDWDKEVQINLLPYSHIYGFFLSMNSLYRGATDVVLRHFEPNAFLGAIEKFKVRMLNVVPPILVFLAKHPLVDKYDISSVEYLMSGAAPAGKDLCEELISKHNHIRIITQGYGMTEMTLASHLPVINGQAQFGNTGKLAPNFEAKIVDLDTGKELGPGERGELWVRSPTVMIGYLNRPEATAETIDKQGWLHTGDIGYHDEHGFLYIVDRLKELIKVRGFQVPPAELEDMLLSHPGVQDVAVIGIPSKGSGELPKAFVVKRDPKLTAEQVADYVKSKVSYYKQLKGGVEFVNEIPKSPSGKILRRFLRDKSKKSAKL